MAFTNGNRQDSPNGAISVGSPSDCKSHAGKYGESTPLRRWGGAGCGLPLTRCVSRRALELSRMYKR